MTKNKQVRNLAYLLADQLLRLILALLLDVLIARNLEPSEYGIYSYAISLNMIFWRLAALGLDGLLLRELSTNTDSWASILKTALIMRILASCLCAIIPCTISWLLNDSKMSFAVVASGSISIVFFFADAINCYFQATMQNIAAAILRSCAYVLAFSLAIFMLFRDEPVYWIAFSISCYLPIVFVFYSLLIGKCKWIQIFKSKFSLENAKYLLSLAWPLVVASLGVVAFNRLGIVMVKQMCSPVEAANFAIATRITEVWQLIPNMLLTVFLPRLSNEFKNQTSEFKQNISGIILLVISIALIITIFLILFAETLIVTLFGDKYLDAVMLVRIQSASVFFSFISVIYSKLIVISSVTFFSLLRQLIGGLSIVLFNFFSIPLFGPSGASIAVVLGYVVATIIVAAFYPKARWMNYSLYYAIKNPNQSLKVLLNYINERPS